MPHERLQPSATGSGVVKPNLSWKGAVMPRDPGSNARTPQLVLLSGGIDSAAALVLALDSGSTASALFVNYGQAAAISEGRASAALAARYGVKHQTVCCSGQRFGAGEIRGRNAFLAHLALMTYPAETGVIVLGIHAGTGYRDCTFDFVDLIQRSYDFHAGGQIALAAPFINQAKGDVVNLAMKLGLPFELTYSCEAGNAPCGQCRSCRDREVCLDRA